MKLLEQNHVKYGLIMAAITALCLVLMELTGQNQSFDQKSPLTIIFMFIAPLIVWYFGISAYKKAHKNKMTFQQGVQAGFKISLVYALVSPFVFLVYYVLVNPAILDYVRSAYGLTGAENAVVIIVDMFVQFVSAIIFGTLYAAVISYFLKSK